MFKKAIAIFLSITLLLTATVASAISDTKPNGMIVHEENFDATPIGEYNLNDGGFSLPGDVFSSPNTAIASGYGQIISDPDNSNNRMFQAYPTVDEDYGKTYANRALYTRELDLGASAQSGTWYAFSYDFKMSRNDANFFVAHDLFQLRNDGWICVITDSYSATPIKRYEADKWYHMEMIAHDDTMWGWLCDSEGNIIATSDMRTYSAVTAGTLSTTTSVEGKLCAYSINHSSSANRGGLVTLDNAKLSVFNPATTGPLFTTVPNINNATEVSVETRTILVVSDQIIDLNGSESVKVTKVDSGTRTCSIESTLNPYTYKVTLPDALEKGSTYILNLSGLKNSMGVSAGDSAKFTFATPAPSVAPEVISSTPENGSDCVSVDTKSMTVAFSKIMKYVPKTVTLAASGVAANITATVTPDEDGKTYNFAWADKLKGDTVYTVDLSEFADEDGVSPVTSSISFTTIHNGIDKFEDGFESGAQASGYGYNTGSDKSAYPLTTGGNHTPGMIANIDGGYTNKALELKTGGSGSGACLETLKTVNAFVPETKTINGDTVYEQLVLTYRINLKKIASRNSEEMIINNSAAGKDNGEYPNGGSNIRFAAAKELSYHTNIARIVSDEEGTPYIGIHGAGPAELEALETDHWYNIIWSVDGTKQTFTLVDSETGKVVWDTKKDLSGRYDAGEPITVYALSAGRTLLNDELCNNDQTVLLDDFTLWRIKPWEEEHSLSLTEDVSQDNKTFAMQFNQPVIGTTDMLKVDVNMGGIYKPVVFNADFTYPDFCCMTVTPKNLAVNSSYVLDYSGIRALSGSTIFEPAAYTGAFSTGFDEQYKVSMVDSINVSDENVISFEIYNGASDNAKICVAYYAENELIGCSAPANEIYAAIGETVDVSVSVIEGYDAFRVFVWDESIRPLMPSYRYSINKE